jgi:hypothetical protein
MATTTNYGWTTPDDTALVKDGAAAIRSLGTSIDTTTKNLNPSTTLGDIEYRSSTANTNTRLPIGTSGQVLTVSGGVPAWATASSGGTNFTLLNAGGTSLSGASTTISGISSRDKLFIFIVGASASAAFKYLTMQFNSDSGTNYNSMGTQGQTTDFGQNQYFQTSGTEFVIARMGDAASSIMGAGILVLGANSSGIKTVDIQGAGNGLNGYMYSLNGYYAGSSAISSITLAVNGTFDAGTVYVYGSTN